MRNYKEFTITRPDYYDTLKVRVYKTLQSLQKACKEINKNQDFSETDGAEINSGFKIINGINYTPDMFTIICLCEQSMELEIIAHECIHATFTHERNVLRFNAVYIEKEHEERFAYYYNWLLSIILKTLLDNGYKVNVFENGKKKVAK